MRHWKLNDGSDVIMDEVRGQGQGLEYKDFIRGQQHWVTVKNGLLADVNK